jgi:undecaprenyl-diphosphatase
MGAQTAQPAPGLQLRHAVALGLLHGPTELLPISSSGHTALVGWLADLDYDRLDPAARKRFEVALHAGALAGLLLVARVELARALAGLGARRVLVLALATAPAAGAGLALQRPIERHLGKPTSIAGGLLGGSAAMALAELAGARGRDAADAGWLDGLALGLGQAVALLPGVSRSGAARAVARARGFASADAEQLAFEVGLPVTMGALALKGREALRGEPAEWAALAAGAVASFASTLAAGSLRRGGKSLLPAAAYRSALATTVLRRLRQNARR